MDLQLERDAKMFEKFKKKNKKKTVHSREVHKYSPHPGLKASKMKTCAHWLSAELLF